MNDSTRILPNDSIGVKSIRVPDCRECIGFGNIYRRGRQDMETEMRIKKLDLFTLMQGHGGCTLKLQCQCWFTYDLHSPTALNCICFHFTEYQCFTYVRVTGAKSRVGNSNNFKYCASSRMELRIWSRHTSLRAADIPWLLRKVISDFDTN